MRMRGADMRRVLPPDIDEIGELVPKSNDVMHAFTVGHRQLVCYASELLLRVRGEAALFALGMLWQKYL